MTFIDCVQVSVGLSNCPLPLPPFCAYAYMLKVGQYDGASRFQKNMNKNFSVSKEKQEILQSRFSYTDGIHMRNMWLVLPSSAGR